MDKILLALLVAATGSLLLPATWLARVFLSRRARQAPSRETLSEAKEQIDHVPLVPSVRAGGVEFRPLTAEEKNEFKNSFEAKRKPRASKPRVYFPSPTIVP